MVNKASIVNRIEKIVLPIAEEMMIDLIEVEFVKESSEWYLRVYIDKVGGITIEECERLSNTLSGILDAEDPIPHAYILEVSSPGLDRPLKTDADYARYKGELLEVFVRKEDRTEIKKRGGDTKIIEGWLVEKKDGVLFLKDDRGDMLEIDMKTIDFVRRAVRFW